MEETWLNFEQKLHGYILSMVHDNAVADDILQEVFIKMHENIDQLNDHTKIRSWLFQICHNLIMDYFRNTRKSDQLKSIIQGKEYEEPVEDLMSESLEDMIRMMSDLPPEYCDALCLVELKGISQKEYAEKSGISYSGAKSRVQRARKMLKDMLMKCCHYEFDKYGTVIGIYPAHCCCCHQ